MELGRQGMTGRGKRWAVLGWLICAKLASRKKAQASLRTPKSPSQIRHRSLLRMGLLVLSQGQIEVKDAVLVFGAACLLRRNEQGISQNGAVEDRSVGPGDQELRRMDEDDVGFVLARASLQDGIVAAWAEHAARRTDEKISSVFEEPTDDVFIPAVGADHDPDIAERRLMDRRHGARRVANSLVLEELLPVFPLQLPVRPDNHRGVVAELAVGFQDARRQMDIRPIREPREACEVLA